MKEKNDFLNEIMKSYRISKEFGKGGYSSFGDRSEYLIKIIKKLKTDDELRFFREACIEFLMTMDKKKVDFIVCALIDGIKFGELIE